MDIENILKSKDMSSVLGRLKRTAIERAKHRIEDGEGTDQDKRTLRLLDRDKPTDISHHGLCFCVRCL